MKKTNPQIDTGVWLLTHLIDSEITPNNTFVHQPTPNAHQVLWDVSTGGKLSERLKYRSPESGRFVSIFHDNTNNRSKDVNIQHLRYREKPIKVKHKKTLHIEL